MHLRKSILAPRFLLAALALPLLSAGCAPSESVEGDEAVDTLDNTLSAASRNKIAALAAENLGKTACGLNSKGGKGFESSCYGNGGQPEYWCSDFARWVWRNVGADVDGLTAAAGTFYCYGQANGTLSNTPHVGDAVVFNYQGNCWADHVALVTKVNANGTIEAISGNWNGKSGSQAYFSSTSSVVKNTPAFPGVVGGWAGPVGMTISGFISPVGISEAAPPLPPPPPEGNQAYLYPNQHHYVNNDGAGNIRHHWWDATTKAIVTDTWGTATAGNPVSFVHGTSQHIFARGNEGSLKHWFWDPVNGPRNDNWATAAGLTGDPAALVIGDFEAVWAVDAGGKLQHWWWGPNTNGVKQDTWGSGVVGRPSVLLTANGEQHAFVRGTNGALEHFWWMPDKGLAHDTWGTGIVGDPAAIVIGDFQGVWAVDGAGKLQHWWWGPTTNGVKHDTWGSDVVGRPSVFLTSSGEQHAFARGTDGSLKHWWWAPQVGILHDTWGTGIVGDPTAMVINTQQHVWALDATGQAKHWYWDPAANSIKQDNWGK